MTAIQAIASDISPQPAGVLDPALVQQAYLKASNTDAGDIFGFSVAVSGNTVVIGAPFEDSSATGVNGDQDDNSAPEAGAVYVFVRDDAGTWAQQAYLKASNTAANFGFGWSVAISGDTLVVGSPGEASNATGVDGDQDDDSAPAAGAVYVFVRDGAGNWAQQAYLKASNTDAGDAFGYSVAISGNTVVVGAQNEASNATGVNGDQNDNSALQAGAAYVFARDDAGTWAQQAYLKASNTDAGDFFGYSVAVSDGTVVIGAHHESSNATGINGDQDDNSALEAGAAYVFARNEAGTWSQQAYLKASNTNQQYFFGRSVAISGETVVVGSYGEASNATGVDGDQDDTSAPGAGASYVYVRDGVGNWSQQAYLKASNTKGVQLFGWSVAISADTVVVGAYGESSNATGVDGDQDDTSAPAAGASYVYVRDGAGIWTQQAYIKASNTDIGDIFGWSVGVSGTTVVVGALYEDSSATGVNGDQDDNSAEGAGAAYVFVDTSDRQLEIHRSGQGLITSQPAGIQCGQTCATLFPFNTTVALSATPAQGWRFDGWSLDCSGDESCELVMGSDKQVGATFIRQRNLNVVTDGTGIVSSDPAGIDCGADGPCQAQFDEGSEVVLTAWSSHGWVLANWGGAAAHCGNASQCTITMDQNRNVGAQFVEGVNTLIIEPELLDFGPVPVGSGVNSVFFTIENPNSVDVHINSISPAALPFEDHGGSCPATPFQLAGGASCTREYGFSPTEPGLSGQIIEISGGEPDSGSAVRTVGLRGTGVGTTGVLTVIRQGQGLVTSQPAGIDCGKACQAEFDLGTNIILTAQPDPGWVLATWGAAGAACGEASECTITLDQNRTVGALFQPADDMLFSDRFQSP